MFEANNIAIKEQVEARNKSITDEAAWQLLSGASEIVVGRGKKFVLFHPDKDAKEDILKLTLGRTGNLRAPTLKIGNRLVIGFNEEMYASFVG